MTAEFRQCTYCGRTGVRGFVSAGAQGVICEKRRTCSARRQAYNRVFDRALKKTKTA